MGGTTCAQVAPRSIGPLVPSPKLALCIQCHSSWLGIDIWPGGEKYALFFCSLGVLLGGCISARVPNMSNLYRSIEITHIWGNFGPVNMRFNMFLLSRGCYLCSGVRSNIGPDLVESGPLFVEVGQNLVRSGPCLSEGGSKLAAPKSAKAGRSRSNVDRTRSKVGRCQQILAELGPNLAGIGPDSVELGPILQVWSNSVQIRSRSVKRGRNRPKLPTPTQCRSQITRSRSTLRRPRIGRALVTDRPRI